MGTYLRMLIVVCVLTLLAPTVQAAVSEVFVVDPGFEGGGYFELTVHNTTGSDFYMLCVGNSVADVVFTSPDLVGKWRARRDDTSDWDAGLAVFDAGFTFPSTTTFPSNIHFPGVTQILTYYVLAGTPGGSPIAPGATMSGFRFKSPIPGSPYVIFDAGGSIVEAGETVDHPLEAEESTWGRIKALYK